MALTPVSSRSKNSSLNTCLASINDLSNQGSADDSPDFSAEMRIKGPSIPSRKGSSPNTCLASINDLSNQGSADEIGQAF